MPDLTSRLSGWIESRAAEAQTKSDPYAKMRDAWAGKGIGAELTFMFSETHNWAGPSFGSDAALGILDGYFKYVSHDPFDTYGEAWIRVSLTRKGMEYFDSLLSLQLECA